MLSPSLGMTKTTLLVGSILRSLTTIPHPQGYREVSQLPQSHHGAGTQTQVLFCRVGDSNHSTAQPAHQARPPSCQVVSWLLKPSNPGDALRACK